MNDFSLYSSISIGAISILFFLWLLYVHRPRATLTYHEDRISISVQNAVITNVIHRNGVVTVYIDREVQLQDQEWKAAA